MFARFLTVFSAILLATILLGCSNGSQQAIDRGNAAYKSGNFDQAITEFTNAIQADSKSAVAYNNRGMAYKAKAKPDLAAADLVGPNSVTLRDASVYYAIGFQGFIDIVDQAIADYNKAVELDPKFGIAYYNRGRANEAKRNVGASLADYSKAIEVAPKDPAAYTFLGIDQINAKQYDKAIADFNQSIENDSQYSRAYNDRGYAYFLKGDMDRAISDLTKAIELNPSGFAAHHNRGDAYAQKGMKAEAIADYEAYLRLLPNAPDRATVEGIIAKLKGP